MCIVFISCSLYSIIFTIYCSLSVLYLSLYIYICVAYIFNTCHPYYHAAEFAVTEFVEGVW